MDQRGSDHAAHHHLWNGAEGSAAAIGEHHGGRKWFAARDNHFGVRQCTFRFCDCGAAGWYWITASSNRCDTFSDHTYKAGAYPFICALHNDLGMKGKVIVLP